MIISTICASNASLPMGFVKSIMAVNYTHMMQEGPSIPMNRNKAFEQARLLEEDLLFIDSDMVFTRKDVETMEQHLKERDIVTGVAVMSWPGHPPALFQKERKSYVPIEELPIEIFEIDGCGAAFLGISKNVLNTLIEPFNPLQEGNGYYGEDISFCIRAKEEGFKIFCDPSLRIGHIKTEVKYFK